MKQITRIAAIAAACSSVVALVGTASAADVHAAASGDWSAPGTWTPNEPTIADNALVDNSFTVTVTQPGEVANRLDLGTASGATGNATISSGDLTVGAAGGADPSVRIGAVGGSTGLLTMTGGTLNINGDINGPLSNGDLQVGRDGNGTMNMSNGAVNVSDEIIIGTGPGAVGNLTVSGGTLTNGTLAGAGSGTGRSFIVGFGLNSQGTATIKGTGTVTVRFDVLMGLFDNGIGTLNIQENGTLNSNFGFISGSTGATSTINQSGGAWNLLAGVVLGQGGTATYNHSAGTYTGNFLTIADNGTGIYNLSGSGSATSRGEVLLGFLANGNGTVNQSGGSVTATTNLRIGVDGIGVYNQSAGTVNAARVFLGDFDTSNGTHRISGGTLTVSGSYSVGGALASNADPDATRTGTQGQAVGAVGNLIVHGNGATINIGGNFLANPADNSRTDGPDNGATLTFEIVSAAGTSLINVAGAGDLDGAVIDMALAGYTPTNGQVFNLIAAAGGFGATGTGTTQNVGTGEGYTLASGDSAKWLVRVVPGQTAGSEILQAVYQVPEPTSAAALGLAAIMLRRRRAAR